MNNCHLETNCALSELEAVKIKKAMISEYFLSFVVFELEFGDSFRGIQMNFRACDFVFGWNLKKWNVDTRENASHAEIL